MTEQPARPEIKVSTEDTTALKQIAEHLASIRGMLKFFTFILIMYIALSILNFVLSI